MTFFPRPSEIPTPATLQSTEIPHAFCPDVNACCKETLWAVHSILWGDLSAANDNSTALEAAA
jgi:hypothetical protein